MITRHPQKIGKYILLGKIGTGGMAELYLSQMIGDKGFEKLVAIKTILPHFASQEEVVTAFIDEARLAAFLHHPNIIQIYDFGSIDDVYFIAMEYLFGKDLQTVLKTAKQRKILFGLEYVLYIALKVCEGLGYAHGLKDLHGEPLNIIHRDISPHNIFITYSGQVKIIDFGIAKAATQTTDTQVGIIKGKIRYMSPEQANGNTIDQRSDIFSVGVMLYELLSGVKLFHGDSFSMLSQVKDFKFDPQALNLDGLPSTCVDILENALAHDVEQRYQSVAAMQADIEACLYSMEVRVNDQSLARFIHSIYDELISKEEDQISKSIKTSLTEAAETNSEDLQQGYEETVILPPASMAERIVQYGRHHKTLISFSAVFLMLILGVFTFFTQEKPVIEEPQPPAPVSSLESIPEKAAQDKPPTNPGESGQAITFQSQLDEAQKTLKSGDDKLALTSYQNLLKQYPDRQTKILSHYQDTLSDWLPALMDSKPEKAQEMLLSLIALNPQNVFGHYKLGTIFLKQQQYDKATAAFLSVVENSPGHHKAYFNLGYLYTIGNNLSEAERMYIKVVALKPDYLDEALVNLAIVYHRLGKNKEAVIQLEKALKTNPDNQPAKNYLQKIQTTAGENGS